MNSYCLQQLQYSQFTQNCYVVYCVVIPRLLKLLSFRHATSATMAIGQHTVCVGKSITEPTWTRPQGADSSTGSESVRVQKWNSPQGGKIHDTDAAAGA